ncbi:hypothetical protein F2Q69_00006454 [Brassica cretica]|uniref:Uncharacterized protein n=1 Tax=Brassica cretica TaxID=69181 RepID=A0A8S9PEY4_BRACR|nr:hypothetical protein F2Q69_00006454 [Brassica cretica]
MSLNELQDQEHTTLTAALKSLIHPFAFSFKYPQITGLPHDLGGDLLLLVCLEPGAQQLRGLRFLNRLLHTSTFPLLHTMDQVFLLCVLNQELNNLVACTSTHNNPLNNPQVFNHITTSQPVNNTSSLSRWFIESLTTRNQGKSSRDCLIGFRVVIEGLQRSLSYYEAGAKIGNPLNNPQVFNHITTSQPVNNTSSLSRWFIESLTTRNQGKSSRDCLIGFRVVIEGLQRSLSYYEAGAKIGSSRLFSS